MTKSITTASGGSGLLNLALLPLAERELIAAERTACLMRWKCRGLGLAERRRLGRDLLAAVPVAARDAVVERLKAWG